MNCADRNIAGARHHMLVRPCLHGLQAKGLEASLSDKDICENVVTPPELS